MKKGFTLVELLASIGIMAILATIITTIAVKKINETKEKSRDILITSIELAAKNYASENLDLLPNLKQYDWENITLQTLVENNKISSNLLDQTTGKNLPLSDKVYVTKSYNGKINAIYDINQNNNGTITLNGSYNIYLDKNEQYIEEGVTAFSKENEEIFSFIVNNSNVNFNRKGNYKITYQIENKIIERNIIILEDSDVLTINSELTIDLDGGNITTDPSGTYEEGTPIILEEPTNPGLIFCGWTVMTGNSAVSANILIIGTQSSTIKANWRVDVFFMLNLDGGNIATDPSGTYQTPKEILLSTPTKLGYTFKEWTISAGDSTLIGNKVVLGTKTTIIKANWRINTYTITYDCNGGTGTMANSTHVYNSSKTLSSNTCYKITNSMVYYFDGWENAEDSSQTFVNNQSVINLSSESNDNIVLKAIWKPCFEATGTYSVVNDLNGNWRIKLTSDQTITFTYPYKVDIYILGGGGGGTSDFTEPVWNGERWAISTIYGARGGAGYFSNHFSISLSTNTYTVTIGTGGSTRNAYGWAGNGTATTLTGFTSAAGGEGAHCATQGVGGETSYEFNDSTMTAHNNAGGIGAEGESGMVVIRNHRG